MRVKNELRKQQKAITVDLKSSAQKAEKILGEIEACEQTLATLNASLSAVLGIAGETATVAKAPNVKATHVKRVMKRKGGRSASQRTSVRDFLVQTGKPMRIAEIVQVMLKAGHVFKAKNPLKAMDRILYVNKKVFKNVSRGLFTAG